MTQPALFSVREVTPQPTEPRRASIVGEVWRRLREAAHPVEWDAWLARRGHPSTDHPPPGWSWQEIRDGASDLLPTWLCRVKTSSRTLHRTVQRIRHPVSRRPLLHPLDPVGAASERRATCAHLEGRANWWRCDLMRGGKATRIRASWPACTSYEVQPPRCPLRHHGIACALDDGHPGSCSASRAKRAR